MRSWKLFLVFFLFIAVKLTSQNYSISEIDSLKATLSQMMIDDQIYRSMSQFGTLDTTELKIMKQWKTKKQVPRFLDAKAGKTGISKKTDDSLWVLQKINDSINVEKLILIINKYGFPNQKLLGNSNIDHYWMGKIYHKYILTFVVIHQLGEKNFNRLQPIFYSELKKGNMHPRNYAQWYDRCKLTMKKKQLYGEYNELYPCVENLETTNQERLKIGLKILKKNNCPPNL